jgi:ATP-dependent RNA helicase DDX3X
VAYGGTDIRQQLNELACGTDVLVATPGRLLDLVDRGVVCLSSVEFLVLDEADRMLNMGFEPQIREIVLNRGMTAKDQRHTFMFSATFASDIQLLAREFLREYVWVTVGRVGSTVENITQRLVLAVGDRTNKIPLLIEAIEATPGRTLVFVQMKKMAAYVCQVLNRGYGIQVILSVLLCPSVRLTLSVCSS